MVEPETFHFDGIGGLSLLCRLWRPGSAPRAVLLLAHGYAEHGGRYLHVGERFAAEGYVVYAPDHRGHGRSQGVRADVHRFEDFLVDLRTLLGLIEEREAGRSVFLVGHSMGGAMAALFAARHGDRLAGLVTSGAGVKISDDLSPVLVALSRLLAVIAPRLPLVPLEAEAISRDPEVVAHYRSDPLVYNGKVRARMGAQIVRATELIAAEMSRIALPALILHGTADRLADPAGSRMLCDGIASSDKTLRLYDGLYHEIFNEPEQEQVLDDVSSWLAGHVSP